MDLRPDLAASDPTEELPPDLRATARRYARQLVPQPTVGETERIVACLLAEESGLLTTGALAAPPTWRQRGHRALRVARWRVRLLGPTFWVASVLALAIGTASALPLRAAGVAGGQMLILVAPMTGVLGLAHALRTPHRGLREVEVSSPVGTAEALAGLVLAIIGFDCLLGLAATLGLALAGWAPFMALLAAWLGPLLLLTGVSLPVALRWGATAAALLGGGPWLLLAVAAQLHPTGPFVLTQDTPALVLRLIAAGIGALLLTLTLVYSPTWSAATSGRGSV